MNDVGRSWTRRLAALHLAKRESRSARATCHVAFCATGGLSFLTWRQGARVLTARGFGSDEDGAHFGRRVAGRMRRVDWHTQQDVRCCLETHVPRPLFLRSLALMHAWDATSFVAGRRDGVTFLEQAAGLLGLARPPRCESPERFIQRLIQLNTEAWAN
jgi:hypothetical protein